MKKTNGFAALALSLVFALTSLVGCGNTTDTNSSLPQSSTIETAAISDTGTLVLKVNPEIAIHYDEKGMVTSVEGINDDGKKLITDDSSYIGKECQEVVRNLVAEINNAGFFVEEVEGQNKSITIEIEKGSVMPSDQFLNNIVTQVRNYVGEMHLASPVDLKGETDYGMTNYQDTDYGPNNDGVTDYNDTDYGPNNDGITDYSSSSAAPASSSSQPVIQNDTDYGPNNDGVTDYNDTDYGPNNDGVTDYNDTDYGPNNDGVTDYNDTDYGPNNDGVTDYNDTDYGPNNDGVTDYNDTDYGPNNDGVTDYNDTDYGPNNDGVTDYNDTDYGPDNDGVTDYNNSNYGSTNYDDNGSTDYNGSSDYDD